MLDLWTTLVPLILASAILPIQIAITLLLLRSAHGVRAGASWVAGLVTVRLVQGVVFGVILMAATDLDDEADGAGPVAATLLVVVGVAFLVTAVRKWLKQPDEDAPPPAWMAMVQSASPGRAYALGLGIVGISAKLWAFTLAAIAAIADADLGPAAASLTYLLFVVLAVSVHLGAVVFTFVAPDRAGVVLDRLSGLLQRYDRQVMVGLATVFGVWLLLKGLAGLQLI